MPRRKTQNGNFSATQKSETLKTIREFFEGLTPDERRAIEENTKKYSAIEEKENGNLVEVIQFLLNNEVYAIETSKTVETFKFSDFTQLPLTPKYLFGLVNIRGRITGVINLKNFFELGSSAITDMKHIIVLKNKDFHFGILTDEILGVTSLDLNGLTEKVLTLNERRSKFLKGITEDGIILLDADKIADSPEIRIESEI